jgi:hypothetical protein
MADGEVEKQVKRNEFYPERLEIKDAGIWKLPQSGLRLL